MIASGKKWRVCDFLISGQLHRFQSQLEKPMLRHPKGRELSSYGSSSSTSSFSLGLKTICWLFSWSHTRESTCSLPILIPASDLSSFSINMATILYPITFMQSHFQPTMIWIKKIWTSSLTLWTTTPLWTITLCMDQSNVWDLKLISLLVPNDDL